MVKSAIICTPCLNALDTAYSFKRKCLHTEEKIMSYASYSGCTPEFINISDVVQHEENTRESASSNLEDVHYPITQIIEGDVDIKPNISEDPLSISPVTYSNVSIKLEKPDEPNDEIFSNPYLPKIPYGGPEVDVMVVGGYKPQNFDDNLLHSLQDVKTGLYSCGQCRESFVLLSDYQAHLTVHMETRAFPCTLCERRFVRKDKLTLHMRIHTGEKPFNCTECGRCFSRKDKLKNHMRTHTGEKPHQCILCQKSFARKDKMNNHMRSQHWLALANLEISVVKTEVKPEQKVSVNNVCQ